MTFDRRHRSGASLANVARDFFDACEAGKGWEVCKAYCVPGATFAAQAEPLADVRTLEQYTEWMKGLMTIMPDGRSLITSIGMRQGAVWIHDARGERPLSSQ